MQNAECRIEKNSFFILNSAFCVLNSDLKKRKLSGRRVNHQCFSPFEPCRQNRDGRSVRRKHELLMEVAEDDVRVAGFMSFAGEGRELFERQCRLVFEIRSRQPRLHSVDKSPRRALRHKAQGKLREGVLAQASPESIRIVTIVDQIAVADEVSAVSGLQ